MVSELQCLDTNINTVIPDIYLAILEHRDTVQDSKDVAKVVSAVPGYLMLQCLDPNQHPWDTNMNFIRPNLCLVYLEHRDTVQTLLHAISQESYVDSIL